MAEGTNRTNSDAVAELAVKAAQKPGLLELKLDGIEAPVAVLPAGIRLESIKAHLDAFRTAPERMKGTAKLGDLASLIGLTNRFKDEHSAIFARPGKLVGDESGPACAPVIEAVFNYNEPTVVRVDNPEIAHDASNGKPRFGDHRAIYAFPFSEEWKAWNLQDGKPMVQELFAAFLEDHVADVASPSGSPTELSAFFFEKLGVEFATPARLVELSRGLTVHVGQKVRNAKNLASGEAQLQFIEEHQDATGGELKVPGAFLLAIPVFQFDAPYHVAVRLRYRVNGGNIVWLFELHRADRIFDHAFREACSKAKRDTELPLFIGSPE